MGLRGLNMLTDILNEFLREGGWEVTAEPGTDFCYWDASNRIEYALCITDWAGERFTKYIHMIAPDIKCDIFLISFLHELGHHETLDEISDEDMRFSMDTKETISQVLNQEKADVAFALAPVDGKIKEAMYDLYFSLPDESAATLWAIDYIRNNAEKVAKFWERVQAAIMMIYELNEVEA